MRAHDRKQRALRSLEEKQRIEAAHRAAAGDALEPEPAFRPIEYHEVVAKVRSGVVCCYVVRFDHDHHLTKTCLC